MKGELYCTYLPKDRVSNDSTQYGGEVDEAL